MQEKDIEQTIKEFMRTKPPVIDIIGYGSAVKMQAGYKGDTKKQIDIIATSNNSLNWHRQNLENNPNEYNRFATYLLRPLLHVGTDINYISDIPYDNNFFKIGVIDRFDFIYDLENWSNFYMAGRTQKPILMITKDPIIETAIAKNRKNALRTALILNTDKVINEKMLFQTLCSLSYLADIRMLLGFENPNKVNNIVDDELEEFKEIYSELNDGLYHTENGIVIANTKQLLTEVQDLPKNMVDYLNKKNINIDSLNINDLKKLRQYIINYIKYTSFKSNVAQPIKSASINNTENTINYLKEKRKKYTTNK
jgi:hypothetical protein